MTRRNYDDPAYKDWRRAVYRRDNRCCQMPGCKSRYKIQAHHIQKWSTHPSLRYEVTNGISLCKECHDSIGTHEEHYVGLFMEIVSSKNGKVKKRTTKKLHRHKRHKRN